MIRPRAISTPGHGRDNRPLAASPQNRPIPSRRTRLYHRLIDRLAGDSSGSKGHRYRKFDRTCEGILWRGKTLRVTWRLDLGSNLRKALVRNGDGYGTCPGSLLAGRGLASRGVGSYKRIEFPPDVLHETLESRVSFSFQVSQRPLSYLPDCGTMFPRQDSVMPFKGHFPLRAFGPIVIACIWDFRSEVC